MGLQIQVFKASNSRAIDAPFAGFVRERPDALFVATAPFLTDRRVQLALLAAIHRIPAIYPWRDFVEVGGLMSYGASLKDAYRLVGVYVGRILKGAKPATCRSSNQPDSNSSSTTRPPGFWASRCPISCSSPPTR